LGEAQFLFANNSGHHDMKKKRRSHSSPSGRRKKGKGVKGTRKGEEALKKLGEAGPNMRSGGQVIALPKRRKRSEPRGNRKKGPRKEKRETAKCRHIMVPKARADQHSTRHPTCPGATLSSLITRPRRGTARRRGKGEVEKLSPLADDDLARNHPLVAERKANAERVVGFQTVEPGGNRARPKRRRKEHPISVCRSLKGRTRRVEDLGLEDRPLELRKSSMPSRRRERKSKAVWGYASCCLRSRSFEGVGRKRQNGSPFY